MYGPDMYISQMISVCGRGVLRYYLAGALQPVAQIPGRQRLRSSSTSALALPSTYGSVPLATKLSLELQPAVGSDAI